MPVGVWRPSGGRSRKGGVWMSLGRPPSDCCLPVGEHRAATGRGMITHSPRDPGEGVLEFQYHRKLFAWNSPSSSSCGVGRARDEATAAPFAPFEIVAV